MRVSHAADIAAAQRPPLGILREQDPLARILLGATS
jgi:hypothetical protein